MRLPGRFEFILPGKEEKKQREKSLNKQLRNMLVLSEKKFKLVLWEKKKKSKLLLPQKKSKLLLPQKKSISVNFLEEGDAEVKGDGGRMELYPACEPRRHIASVLSEAMSTSYSSGQDKEDVGGSDAWAVMESVWNIVLEYHDYGKESCFF